MTVYPHSPGFKVSGPSRDAAIAEEPRAQTLREQVASLFCLNDADGAKATGGKAGAEFFSVRLLDGEIYSTPTNRRTIRSIDHLKVNLEFKTVK